MNFTSQIKSRSNYWSELKGRDDPGDGFISELREITREHGASRILDAVYDGARLDDIKTTITALREASNDKLRKMVPIVGMQKEIEHQRALKKAYDRVLILFNKA